jgi:hypothetical protein
MFYTYLNEEATMHLTELLLAAAILGLLAAVLGRIAWDVLAPMLCRARGHQPRQLGLYVRVCKRCGRNIR